MLVTLFRAYLDYFGFRSARDVALGSHSEPLAKHVRRSAFGARYTFFVPTSIILVFGRVTRQSLGREPLA